MSRSDFARLGAATRSAMQARLEFGFTNAGVWSLVSDRGSVRPTTRSALVRATRASSSAPMPTKRFSARRASENGPQGAITDPGQRRDRMQSRSRRIDPHERRIALERLSDVKKRATRCSLRERVLTPSFNSQKITTSVRSELRAQPRSPRTGWRPSRTRPKTRRGGRRRRGRVPVWHGPRVLARSRPSVRASLPRRQARSGW